VTWCVDLDAIISNIENIVGFDDDKKLKEYLGPSLFINGE
jgi:hypothetical protein